MKEPIYRAFKAARVEEALAYKAADSIPDDVVSRDELLEVVNRFEVKFDETKAAISENRVAIAEAAAKNEVAIAENRAAIAEAADKIAENRVAIAEAADKIAENRVAIAEAADKIAENRVAIAEATAKNEVAIAAAKVEMIRWMIVSNAMFATVIIAVLKLL